MELALEEARRATDHDDVPVGAVVVINGQVIAQRHNERELSKDPTAHAEILALRDAATAIGQWRLSEAVLYVTLEPCVMCAGAIVASRLGQLIYGAVDPKAGAVGSLYNVCVDPRLNHEVTWSSGLEAEASGDLLREFFSTKRSPGSDPRSAPRPR